jgi:hypothetical protein
MMTVKQLKSIIEGLPGNFECEASFVIDEAEFKISDEQPIVDYNVDYESKCLRLECKEFDSGRK